MRDRHNAAAYGRGDHMGRACTLLVPGLSDDAEAMGAALRGLGFSVRSCAPDAVAAELDAAPSDALILTEPADIPARSRPRAVVSLCGPVDGADAVIADPAHPMQVASRTRALLRLSVLEETAQARAMDVAAAGLDAPAQAEPAGPAAILYVGPPHPAFMRLQHAMAGAGAETIAAFSTFNAFDYLHERAFDAVVLSTLPTPDLAHTVCSAMRRNTRLFHTPTLLLSHGEGYGGAEEAFARGASDILPDDAPAEALRARIMALAGERRRRKAAKRRLESCRLPALLDERSDLFTPAFGHAHLDGMIARAARSGLAMSAVSLLVSPPAEAIGPGGHAGSAMNQFASMLRHCVRAEDMAVRAGEDRFYLALPDTSAAEAGVVASRVVAIAECTAYEGADPTRPFRLQVQYDIAQARPGEDADALVGRAFSELPAVRRDLAV